MKFQFLTRVNRYKAFQFTPRFYDERKERIKNMIAENEKSENSTQSEQEYDFSLRKKEALRDSLSNSWGRSEQRIKQKKSANVRVVIILLGILALGYFIFSNNKNADKPLIHKIN